MECSLKTLDLVFWLVDVVLIKEQDQRQTLPPKKLKRRTLRKEDLGYHRLTQLGELKHTK